MQEENPLVFPKQADEERLKSYDYYEKLYFGDHFDAFSLKAEDNFSQQYAKLRYVVANFPGLMSRVVADMLFSERVIFDANNKNNQDFISKLLIENKLITQCYESALANSRRGDSVFKIRIAPRSTNPSDKSTIIIEEVNPNIYFPVLDPNAPRYTPVEDVLAWTFKAGGRVYLHKETHKAGYVFHEIFRYDPDRKWIINRENPTAFGFNEVEETKVNRSLIFHIPNVRDGSSFFGTSDYRDLTQLFFALNNRLTKTDNILDKHSDPILAVPEGVIDENGTINKKALNMFEVDNQNPGFNKPEYIVWNANLDAAFKEIDKMLDLLFMFSDISPSSMGLDKGGQAESGRALKFKLIRTIAKRNRKKMYYDSALKELLKTSLQLSMAWGIQIDGSKASSDETISINWGDGIINDETEMVDNTVKRIDSGTMSKADAIAELDGLSPEEAKKKAKEIEDESSIKVPHLDPIGSTNDNSNPDINQGAGSNTPGSNQNLNQNSGNSSGR